MSLSSDLAKMARDNGIETRKLANNSVSTDKLFQLNPGQFIGRDNTQSGTGNVGATQSYPDISLTSALSAPYDATTAWRSLSSYLNQVANTNYPIISSGFLDLNISSSGKFTTAILHPNGKIYMTEEVAPGVDQTVTAIGILDPESSSVTRVALGTGAGVRCSQGAVLAPNGKIYFHDANPTVVFDPSNNTSATVTGEGGSIYDGWEGGALASDGKIYWCPNTATAIIRVDPTTNIGTALGGSFLIGGDTGSNQAKYTAVYPAPNGKLYFWPSYESRLAVLDPSANTITQFTVAIPFGSGRYSSACLALNGKFYTFPEVTGQPAAILDPSNNTATTFNYFASTSQQFKAPILLPNGKIYLPPYAPASGLSTVFRLFDPETLTDKTFAGIAGLASNAYYQSVFHPDGNIYQPPYSASKVLKISFNFNNNWNKNVCINPLLVRSYS
jgi:streptogramin lyase